MAETPKSPLLPVARLLDGGSIIASGVPEGLDAAVLGALARQLGSDGAGADPAHRARRPAARDARRRAPVLRARGEALELPRLGRRSLRPRRAQCRDHRPARRTLAELAGRNGTDAKPLIVLTTVNAVLQRVPPHDFFASAMQRLLPGNAVSMASLIERLENVGYGRAGTVTDPGQYAVRGGILDFYPPGGRPGPPRLLRRHAGIGPRLRSRDAANVGAPRRITLLPMSEAPLDEEARKRFRARYVELFGPVTGRRPALRVDLRRPPASGHGALAAAVP